MDKSDGTASSAVVLKFAVDRPPAGAFAVLTDRLIDGLRRQNIGLELRPGGGLKDGEVEFGQLTVLRPGEELVLETRPVTWETSPPVTLRLRLERTPTGSLVSLEVEGWSAALGGSADGFLDWCTGTLLPTVVRQFSPSSLGDWVTDRKARRPTGPDAVAQYRDPTYHWPNFLLILDRVKLTSVDRLLEVACGAGAFLHRALESGCTARAVDHSPDMVRATQEANRSAIDAGRLEVFEGDAEHLPVPDSSFTCCVCTGAFDFFPDPLAALREMHRALVSGGRLAVFASSEALRGTPAAPEPIASRVRFSTPSSIARLAVEAGFSEVRVEEPAMEPYARHAGLPEEAVAFFRGSGGGHLLLARKPAPI